MGPSGNAPAQGKAMTTKPCRMIGAGCSVSCSVATPLDAPFVANVGAGGRPRIEAMLKGSHDIAIEDKILNRRCGPEAVNLWVACISSIRTRNGCLYSAALNVFSVKNSSWNILPKISAELISSAMQMTFFKDQFSAATGLPMGTLFGGASPKSLYNLSRSRLT